MQVTAYIRVGNKRKFIGVFASYQAAMAAGNIVAPPSFPPTQLTR